MTNAIDGTERWWQSPPLSRGLGYNEVDVTLDLGQVRLSYLNSAMNSCLPAAACSVTDDCCVVTVKYSTWVLTEGEEGKFSALASALLLCEMSFVGGGRAIFFTPYSSSVLCFAAAYLLWICWEEMLFDSWCFIHKYSKHDHVFTLSCITSTSSDHVNNVL